ncbi:hypothetical protein [Thalassotalea atypica]|uniref:hypothetical protein n=1 Tax=Thalassotalea atypica TaxID=2054316 RepID=UPI0025734024|nr:hypothetical protein [Thalassotalea atypica]
MDRHSILANATSSEIVLTPYPHIVIKNALDPEIFNRLSAEFPDVETVLDGKQKKDTWYDYPACKALQDDSISEQWKAFLSYHTSNEFFQDLVTIFGDAINKLHPNITKQLGKSLSEFSTSMRQTGAANNPENYESDISLECQFYVNFTEQPREVRGPHVDRPSELFAALLYFRDEEDDSSGSDLAVCEITDPMVIPSKGRIHADHLPMELEQNKVTISNEVKYEANTLVLFINSERSVHAVTPRTATPIPRKHINFTGDLFNLESGLFKVELSKRKRLKRWLESKPVIWRAAKLIED